MSLFRFDFLKVFFQKSVPIIFFICIAVNLFLINYQEAESGFYYNSSAYRAVFDDLSSKSNLEAYDILKAKKEKLDESNNPFNLSDDAASYALEYTMDIWQEKQLIDDCFAEIKQVVSYAEYIDEIKENADNMFSVSIFKNAGEFSSRNIVKTAEDFAPLRDIPLEFGVSKGVKMATGFVGTDFIALIMLLIVVFHLVLSEREQGLFALICPTKNGKARTAVSKIKVLLVSSVIILLSLYLMNFLSALVTYGFGDLSRPIQSVFGYYNCVLTISVWQYFALFGLAKLAVIILVGLLMFCMCLVWKNSMGIYVSVIGVFLGSALLHFSIPMNSPVSALKYINIVYFLRTDQILTQYLNINVFNLPINIVAIFSIVLCIVAALLLFLIIYMMNGYHIFLIKKARMSGLLSKMAEKRKPRPKGLLYYEFLKGLWHNKSIAVAAIFILIQLYAYANYSLYIQPKDIYYKSYMNYLGGAITFEKEEYIQRETMRINDLFLSGTVHEYNLVELQDGWDEVLSRYDRIVASHDQAHDQAGDLWFVYDRGYQQLTGGNEGMDLAAVLKMITILTVCLSSIFAREYSTGMNEILATTQNGRGKTLRAKLILSVLFSTLIFIISYGFDFLSVYHKVGMDRFSAPLQSLDDFTFFSLPLTIVQYMMLLYAIRLLGMCLLVLIISAISVVSRNTLKSMIAVTGILSLPVVLSLLGISVVNQASLVPVLSGNMFLRYLTLDGKGAGSVVISVTIFIMLIILSVSVLKKTKGILNL